MIIILGLLCPYLVVVEMPSQLVLHSSTGDTDTVQLAPLECLPLCMRIFILCSDHRQPPRASLPLSLSLPPSLQWMRSCLEVPLFSLTSTPSSGRGWLSLPPSTHRDTPSSLHPHNRRERQVCVCVCVRERERGREGGREGGGGRERGREGERESLI